ncbi:hypothetical protein D3C87_1976840 [compost metagenome]
MLCQQRFRRLQARKAFGLGHGFELRQRDAALHTDTARVDATQKDQVCAATQCGTDVLTQGADVGAFAATHYHFDSWLRLICKRSRQF